MKKYIKAEIKIVEIESTTLMAGSGGNIGGPDAPGYLAPKQNEQQTQNFGNKSESSSIWSDKSDRINSYYEEE